MIIKREGNRLVLYYEDSKIEADIIDTEEKAIECLRHGFNYWRNTGSVPKNIYFPVDVKIIRD